MESSLKAKKVRSIAKKGKGVKESSSQSVGTFAILKRELLNDKLAMTSLFFIIAVVLTVTIWPLFLDTSEIVQIDLFNTNNPPSAQNWLGTNDGGQDVFGLLLIGARNSLSLSVLVVLITGTVGILIGLISGYFGGQTDNVLMRVVDFFNILPTLVITIVFVTISADFSFMRLVFILSIFGWMGIGRLLRSRTLQERELEYVQASKTLGTPPLKIMFREVFPNVLPLIIVNMTLNMAGSIGLETGLTFLGFGFPPEMPSLGTLIASARIPNILENRPWIWLPALALVVLLMLSINNVGHCLKRATDARQRRG